MSDRQPCIVPFCRRTTKRGRFGEWCCQKHWSAVPAYMRKVYTRVKRRWRKTQAAHHRAQVDSAWRRCRRAALERAAGIY